MTHQNDYTFTRELAAKGLEAVPELLRVLINNAMQAEMSHYLQAGEYERTETGQIAPTGINQRPSRHAWVRSLFQYPK